MTRGGQARVQRLLTGWRCVGQRGSRTGPGGWVGSVENSPLPKGGGGGEHWGRAHPREKDGRQWPGLMGADSGLAVFRCW